MEKNTVILDLEVYDGLKNDLAASQEALNDEMNENARLAARVVKMESYILGVITNEVRYLFSYNTLEEIYKHYSFIHQINFAAQFDIDSAMVKAHIATAYNEYKEEQKAEESNKSEDKEESTEKFPF